MAITPLYMCFTGSFYHTTIKIRQEIAMSKKTNQSKWLLKNANFYQLNYTNSILILKPHSAIRNEM